jgi:hypothetical protein
MSFMAGFGPAFANSFGAARDRREQRKDDLFKLTYKEYLDRRSEYESKKAEDAASIKKARVLARDLAGDESLWPKIKEWVDIGYTPDAIKGLISEGEFENTGVAKPASPDMIDPVAQTADTPAVGTPSPEPVAAGGQEPQMPQVPGQGGGMMDKLFPGRAANNADRQQQEMFGQIGQVTGESPDQIKDIMTGKSRAGLKVADMEHGIIYKKKPGGYEPDKIDTDNEAAIELMHAKRAYETTPTAETEMRLQVAEDRVKALDFQAERKIRREMAAKAESEGNFLNMQTAKIMDENGNYQKTALIRKEGDNYQYYDKGTWQDVDMNSILPFRKDEESELTKLASSTRAISEEYMKSVSATKDLLHTARTMSKIVEVSSGSVLAERTGNLASLATDWAQELVQIGSLLSKGNSVPTLDADLDRIQDNLDSMLSTGVTDAATYRNLMKAQETIMSYRLLQSWGQEGRSVSEAERAMTQAIVKSAGSPEKFNQNLALILQDQVRSLEGKQSDINKYNIDIKTFEDRFGWRPAELVPSLQKVINDPSEVNTRDAYDYFKPFMNLDARGAPQEKSEDGSIVIDGYKIKVKGAQ